MWLEIFKLCVPILVAFVGIIPAIISNRKKTQQSIAEMKSEVKEEIKAEIKKEVSSVKQEVKEEVRTEMAGMKEDLQRVKSANASSLYFQIESACTQALSDGEIDKDAYHALKAAWDAYHATGGNGFLNALMQKVDDLPFKKDYKI